MDARVLIVDSQIFSRLTAPREKKSPLRPLISRLQNKFHAPSQKSLFFMLFGFLAAFSSFFQKEFKTSTSAQRQEQKASAADPVSDLAPLCRRL